MPDVDDSTIGRAGVRRATFGPFEFDAVAGELRRDGRLVPLQPQPAKVLARLLEKPGDVVTRAELKAHVWGADTFVDFERGLNFAVAQVRQALSDSADVPRFVQTVPRQGYRFIAPVATTGLATEPRVELHASPPVPVATSPASETNTPHVGAQPLPSAWRSTRLWAATALVVLLTATAVWWTARAASSTSSGIRVAIVRFDNDTGAASDEPLVQGITDVTVAQLAELGRGLSVIGNADELRGGRSFSRLAAIRQALDPRYLVVGQFQRHDGHVRVVAHLIRADDLGHLWAHPFEADGSNPFGLQRDVGQAIAGAVWERLREHEPELTR